MRALAVAVLCWLGGGLSCTWQAPAAPPPPAPPAPASVSVATPMSPEEQVAARFSDFQTGLAEFEVRAVSRAVVEESRRNGLDWEFVLAVIDTESSFNNFARSRVGALGLMQIMPRTGQMLARELGLPWKGASSLLDPVVNVKLGTRYLASLHARYRTWDAALAAYNWGPAAIDRRLRHGRQLPVRYPRSVYARVDQQTGS